MSALIGGVIHLIVRQEVTCGSKIFQTFSEADVALGQISN
jgi:hypothetical protein